MSSTLMSRAISGPPFEIPKRSNIVCEHRYASRSMSIQYPEICLIERRPRKSYKCRLLRARERQRGTRKAAVHEKGSRKRSSRDIYSLWGARAATVCTARHQLQDSYFNCWLCHAPCECKLPGASWRVNLLWLCVYSKNLL